MALIKCPECGKEISDKSEKCIHCGYKHKEKICDTALLIKGIIGIAFVLLVVYVVYTLNNNDKTDDEYDYSYIYDNYDYDSDYGNSYSDYSSKDDFSFSNWSIKDGNINDTVYVEITNNTNQKLKGSATAYIYKNGQIVESSAVLFPNDGIDSGDTVTAHGIFNTVNGNYDNVKFEINYTYEAD